MRLSNLRLLVLRHYSNGFKAESAHKKEQRERRNVYIQSIIFRHLPPNSARTGYTTQGELLYLRADVYTDAVSNLRKVWVYIYALRPMAYIRGIRLLSPSSSFFRLPLSRGHPSQGHPSRGHPSRGRPSSRLRRPKRMAQADIPKMERH